MLQKLLLHDETIHICEFLNDLNLQDCLPLFSSAWSSIKQSTLHKVWKSLLGDSFVKEVEKCSQLESIEHIHEFQYSDESTNVPDVMVDKKRNSCLILIFQQSK